ncbi:MAG: hypothetical protein ACRD1K_16515 [Acidimicrobiales bacterium]
MKVARGRAQQDATAVLGDHRGDVDAFARRRPEPLRVAAEMGHDLVPGRAMKPSGSSPS